MDIQLTYNADKTLATITLNRVAKGNALNKAFIKLFNDTLVTLQQAETVKVCVIESAAKHFCVGADINWLQDSLHLTEQQNIADVTLLADLLQQLYQMPCVMIAKVHGCVYGGGLGVLACCDVVLADANSRFCFSEINLGIAPATIAPYVRNKMSLQAMRQTMLSAKVFDAKQAKQYGLVDALFTDVDEQVILNAWIDIFIEKPKQAIMENKKMLAELAGIDDDLIQQSIQRLAAMRQSATGQRCLKALLDKLNDKAS